MPVAIGTITTCTMLINMVKMSTSTIVPANAHTNIGVTKGASKVDTVVTPTDRARSPFAKKVITLDAVPPGQHPTSITPTARPGGKRNMTVSR